MKIGARVKFTFKRNRDEDYGKYLVIPDGTYTGIYIGRDRVLLDKKPFPSIHIQTVWIKEENLIEINNKNFTEREENSKNKLKITKILPNGNNLIKEDIMLNKKEVERYTITGRDNMNLELIAGRNRQLQNIKRFMYSKDYTTFEKKNKKLRKQNQLMKKALEQYANPFYEEQPINQLAITTLKKIRGIK